MKNTETETIGFDQQNEPAQAAPTENPLGNILSGIFSNLEGDPNAPVGDQELNLDEFAELAESFLGGLGLGKSLKDATDKVKETLEQEKCEEKPQTKNINITFNIGDVRFK